VLKKKKNKIPIKKINDLKKLRRKRSKYEGKTKIYEVLKHKDSKEL